MSNIMEKRIPVWVLALVVFTGANLAVIFGWFVRHVSEGGEKLGSLGPIVMAVARFPSHVKNALHELLSRSPLLIDDRFPRIDGFRKDGVPQEGAARDDGYLLLSAYDARRQQSTVKLIRIRDEKVLHEWVPDIGKLAASHGTRSADFDAGNMSPRRYRIANPVLTEDGGIVFHDVGPLFKIGACSNLEWVVNGVFHHSVERDADGNFWVPSFVEPGPAARTKFPPFRDEAITQVSPDGRVLLSRSVSAILERAGQRGLMYGTRLFGNRSYEYDALHLNDIQPALYSSPYWEKGDLLLSIRNLSTVLLYRPGTDNIVWLKTGPWLHQHDVDFVGNSRISVYGNDVVRKLDGREVLFDGHNSSYLLDLASAAVSSPYAGVLGRAEVRTLTEGRQDVLEGGDIFVEETNYGRLLRVSPRAVVWEFVVRVDDRTLAISTWSRYLSKERAEKILPALERAACHG
jgi:hypothetical protein